MDINSAYKDWLDKTVKDGTIKYYSDDDIVNRTVTKRTDNYATHRAKVKHSEIPVTMKTFSSDTLEGEDAYKDFVREVYQLKREL
jgi:hypothetical protein